MEVSFTDEELAEFTPLNRAAVDLILLNLEKEDDPSIPPCWLCMNENGRSRARKNLISLLNEQMQYDIPLTEETAADLIGKLPNIEQSILAWKRAELELKKQRVVNNNPRAYFIK